MACWTGYDYRRKGVRMTYEKAIQLAHMEGFTYVPEVEDILRPGIDVGYVVGSMYDGVILPPHAARNYTALAAAIYTFVNTNSTRPVGGWYDHDTQQYYLDVVCVGSDLDSAMAIGRDNSQKAIFDLARNMTIEVPPFEKVA